MARRSLRHSLRHSLLASLLLGSFAGTLVAPRALRAQEPAPAASATASPATVPVQEILLRDGSRLFGRVVASDADSLTIVTTSGARVSIARAQVERMRAAAEIGRAHV